MALIANLRHFLDEDGSIPELPDAAMKLVGFLTRIVSTVSKEAEEPIVDVDIKCCERSNELSCDGYIEAWVSDNMDIQWCCNTCDENGVISNWHGSQWDHHDKTVH